MAESKMNTTLKWKGEVTFEGTIDQFNSFRESLETQSVHVGIPELQSNIFTKIHPAGYITPAISAILSAGRLAKIAEKATRFQFKGIDGIAGGIRSPHLHIGEEVILIDKEVFKNILSEAASNIAQRRVDAEDDYCNMIKSIMAE